MITITVNDEQKQIEPDSKVIDLITGLDLNPDTVVVELDGKILNREDYESLILKQGAVLELIRFVGGG